jgi:hypothetical protein
MLKERSNNTGFEKELKHQKVFVVEILKRIEMVIEISIYLHIMRIRMKMTMRTILMVIVISNSVS